MYRMNTGAKQPHKHKDPSSNDCWNPLSTLALELECRIDTYIYIHIYIHVYNVCTCALYGP